MYDQLCVWPATIVGEDKVKDFEEFMKEELGARVKYIEEVTTLPDVEDGEPIPETGERNDIFFYVHSEDIPQFAIQRLMYGIRWWEDVVGNNNHLVYPQKVIDKYPVQW